MSKHNENNHHEHGHDHSHHEHSSDENSLKDPVCGMTVTSQSKHSYSLKNIAYYFCSNGCKEKFIGAPSKYLDGGLKDSESPASVAGTIYTCPMHPQIRQNQPGNCPICGMSLEPLLPELEEEENPELVDFQRRFWWTLPLTTVVTVLAMFGHKFNLLESQTQTWVELFLSLPIVLWAGWPFFHRGWQSIANRSPNMWTL
uniref:heavy metal-binding domain-containing protein n=1 Tax=Polynucleobacter sp. TaxID=2029855 RepID=UPI003F6A1FAF